MKGAGRLIHWALVLFVLNSLAAVVQAGYALHNDLSWLGAATLARLTVVTVALLLMLAAVKQLRVTAQIYQDHARFLRQLVLVLSHKASDHDRELARLKLDVLTIEQQDEIGPATSQ